MRHYDRETCVWKLGRKGVRQTEGAGFKCSHFCHIGIQSWGMIDYLKAYVLRKPPPKEKKEHREVVGRSEFVGKRCVMCKRPASFIRFGGEEGGDYLCSRKGCDKRWRMKYGFFMVQKMPRVA